MLNLKKTIGLGASLALITAVVGTTGVQAASSMSICKTKTSGSLSIRTSCTSSQSKISNFSQLIGAKGAVGARGTTGVAGASGTAGSAGTAGAAGAAGAIGPDGAAGAAGAAGVGATQASVGQACAVTVGVLVTPGVFAWVETAVASGIYTMGCDVNVTP